MPAFERRSAALKHKHDVSDIAGLTGVQTSRKINTTAPLTGGGDLSADRTLGVSQFSSAAPGIVPASGGGAVNFMRADGVWAAPPGGAVAAGSTDSVLLWLSI